MRRYVGDPQARERHTRRVAIIVALSLVATFVLPALAIVLT